MSENNENLSLTLFLTVASRRRDIALQGDLEEDRDKLKNFYEELKEEPFYRGYDFNDFGVRKNYRNAKQSKLSFIGTNSLDDDRDRTVKAALQPRIG